jgi:hypothetical protein
VALKKAYLFNLATICHCPPPMVPSLTVSDFARLVTGIDQMRAQTQPQGG